jgi:hypothetical protein
MDRDGTYLGLRLGGLAHESASNGPAHGGGVDGVVHQALGNVDAVNAARILEGAQVQDELVSAPVCHRKVTIRPHQRVTVLEEEASMDNTQRSFRIRVSGNSSVVAHLKSGNVLKENKTGKGQNCEIGV